MPPPLQCLPLTGPFWLKGPYIRIPHGAMGEVVVVEGLPTVWAAQAKLGVVLVVAAIASFAYILGLFSGIGCVCCLSREQRQVGASKSTRSPPRLRRQRLPSGALVKLP